MSNAQSKAQAKALVPAASSNPGRQARRAAERKFTKAQQAYRKQRANGIGPTNAAKLDSSLRKLDGAIRAVGVSKPAVLAIGRSLCAPVQFPATRFQDGFSSKPTAMAEPYIVQTATPNDTVGSGTDGLGVVVSSQIAAFFRDPRRAMVYYDPNSDASKTYTYAATVDGLTTFSAPANMALDIDYFTPSGGNWKPHGEKLYMAHGPSFTSVDSTTRYVPLTKGTQIIITGVPASTAITLSLNLAQGEDTKRFTRTENSTAGGAVTFDIGAALDANGSSPGTCGYYCFNINAAITNGTVSIQGQGGCWCHLSLAEFENDDHNWETMRFNALGAMWSASAPVLSRGGRAVGCQLNKDKDWIEIANSGIGPFALLSGAARMDSEEGIYGFYRPTSIKDFEFQNVGSVRFEQSPDAYPIIPESDYLMIMLDILAVEGRAGYWSMFTHVEGHSDSLWKDRRVPNHKKAEFEHAIELSTKVP